jgi:hypothetical protein
MMLDKMSHTESFSRDDYWAKVKQKGKTMAK